MIIGNTVLKDEPYEDEETGIEAWLDGILKRNEITVMDAKLKAAVEARVAKCRMDEPRTERINGVVYMMASANFWHFTVTENISTMIKQALGRGPCLVSMEKFDYKYHADHDNAKFRDDYLCPDIMIMCDKTKIKADGYYGVPKFIVEVASPSIARYDRTEKMQIYEEAGVDEYWIVSQNRLDIYYLVDGRYQAERAFILCDDKDNESYNADTPITLRCFPQVTMTLGSIFEELI